MFITEQKGKLQIVFFWENSANEMKRAMECAIERIQAQRFKSPYLIGDCLKGCEGYNCEKRLLIDIEMLGKFVSV